MGFSKVLQSIDDGLRDILMLSRVLSESLLQPENLANIETLSSDLGTQLFFERTLFYQLGAMCDNNILSATENESEG